MTTNSRILIVDDDPGLLAHAAEELLELGHEVVEAASGDEAMEKFVADRFDIVISDLEMPGTNGLELVRGIRELDDDLLSAIPIIMLTGRGDDQAIQASFECGASSFVQKPVNWLHFSHHLNFILRAGAADAKLRETHKAAERTSAARQNLMVTLQHELRSPLHVITGYADVIAASKDGVSEDIAEAVGFMRGSALDINDRLSKLFLMSNLIGGDVKLDLRSVYAEESLKDVLRVLRHRDSFDTTDVTIDLPQDLKISADPTLFMKAAENILENALKFGKGKVRVTEGVHADGSRSLRIADDGEGFDAERAAELMQFFGQGDSGLQRESTGLGLGLATAQQILELHNGSLELSNCAELGGALVTLKMPAERIAEETSDQLAAAL